MAKFIRHDFGGIHDSLNKMIVAEVKAALMELPDQNMEAEGVTPLCRIVVSDADNYRPMDLSVYKVWLDDGVLRFGGRIEDSDYDVTCDEDDDLLDVTDFGYLIDQIAEQVEGDGPINIANKSFLTCGYVAEFALRTAAQKTF